MTPSDGVLVPDELLTSSIGGGRSTIAVECRVVPSPQAPRRAENLLRAGRLDCEDRGQEAEDQEHRESDHEPDPEGGEGELAHRCVHVGETP